MRRAFVLVGVMLLLSACGSAAPTRATTGAAHRSTTTTTTTTTGPAAGGSSASTTSRAMAGAPTTTGARSTSATSTSTPTAPAPAPTTTSPAPTTVSSDASDGGLTIELTADPWRGPTGSAVTFTLKATETSAPGALHYEVAYGDGNTDSNVTPLVCTPSAPAGQTWTLSHRYVSSGTYRVTATVGVNCSPDQAAAAVTVSRSAG